jgi:hydroxymethylpyrimidine/phosphomethylpyrimidine kinase
LCTIAGSDPTGGAGFQADLATFRAHGAPGYGVATALTRQDRAGVHAIEPRDPALVAGELADLLDRHDFGALKTGMLATGAIVDAVGAVFDARGARNLVVDPVLAASGGGRLLDDEGEARLAARLGPHAALLTPNLDEAAALLGRASLEDADAEGAGRLLRERGWAAVLVKGGHGRGANAVDVLVESGGVTRFESPRLSGPPVHGTGCALSAAIAARLARGEALADAVRGAKSYVHRLIGAAHAAGTWLLPHGEIEPRA